MVERIFFHGGGFVCGVEPGGGGADEEAFAGLESIDQAAALGNEVVVGDFDFFGGAEE